MNVTIYCWAGKDQVKLWNCRLNHTLSCTHPDFICIFHGIYLNIFLYHIKRSRKEFICFPEGVMNYVYLVIEGMNLVQSISESWFKIKGKECK